MARILHRLRVLRHEPWVLDVHPDSIATPIFPEDYTRDSEDLGPANQSHRKKPVNPLDPLEVTGAVQLRYVLDYLASKKSPDAKWIKALHEGNLIPTIGLRKPGDKKFIPEADLSEKIWTRKKYLTHFQQMLQKANLTQKSVISRCEVNVVLKAYAAYFAVDKTIRKMRAIGDCRATNAYVRDPPPTPLLSTDTLIRLLLFFDDPWFSEADLRHWFYQILLNGADRNFFGLALEGWAHLYHFNALPMGFSWAPFLAQIISKAIATRDTEKSFAIREGAGFIEIRTKKDNEIVAFICIYYDNFLVIAKNQSLRDKLRDILQNNAKVFNAQWKFQFPDPNGDMENDGQPSLVPFKDSHLENTFLGGSYFSKDGQIRWRHAEKNIEKWRNIHLLTSSSTVRDVQKICGVGIWDMSLRLWKRRDVYHFIEALSLAAKAEYFGSKGWKEVVPLPPDLLERVNSAFQSLLANFEETGSRGSAKSKELIIATDSSLFAKGIVHLWQGTGSITLQEFWCSQGRIDKETGKPVQCDNCPECSRDIWQKELDVALSALETEYDNGVQDTIIFFLEDNSTASAALRHEVCGDPELNNRLGILPKLRRERNTEIIVVQTPSAAMPADTPSRMEQPGEDFKERCKAAQKLVDMCKASFWEYQQDATVNPISKTRLESCSK